MLHRFWIAAAFFSGIALGVVTASHVWLISARALREASLAEYQVEQEFLASRSARQGDAFREVVHRLNVADAQAGIGFQWLKRSESQSYWEWFRFPWASYWLLRGIDLPPDGPSYQRGRDLLEAHYRAAAALALERWGKPTLASNQWSRVSEIEPSRTVEEHREFYRKMSVPSDPEAEAAYLNSASYGELRAALEPIWRRAGVE